MSSSAGRRRSGECGTPEGSIGPRERMCRAPAACAIGLCYGHYGRGQRLHRRPPRLGRRGYSGHVGRARFHQHAGAARAEFNVQSHVPPPVGDEPLPRVGRALDCCSALSTRTLTRQRRWLLNTGRTVSAGLRIRAALLLQGASHHTNMQLGNKVGEC